ncbi:MAG: CopG family transcriptional regulator [Chloroflexota bacterium]
MIRATNQHHDVYFVVEVASLHRTNIYLGDDQLRALKHLAAEEHASVADLVRKAIDAYLVPRFSSSDDWGRRFDDLAESIQRRMPAGATPEQIEADITAARAEVRLSRQARRR